MFDCLSVSYGCLAEHEEVLLRHRHISEIAQEFRRITVPACTRQFNEGIRITVACHHCSVEFIDSLSCGLKTVSTSMCGSLHRTVNRVHRDIAELPYTKCLFHAPWRTWKCSAAMLRPTQALDLRANAAALRCTECKQRSISPIMRTLVGSACTRPTRTSCLVRTEGRRATFWS
ncbi:hypothetical protein VCUG_02180 [Vavraia culicis subsp. floridensis]|uniref:Uncharacterized protein n=1 Tax=Vavraia culicis (isolate floridensis) TaxID=948595 RepID=L2GTA4_VAVCU|nr:uncharacterized protein VCUG_02180 [Vavraia culicis subsp. floridensis]ELA46335.1 hypothetical protein VCUG_02180 [Vavraia culicis subsp. floridensis]